MKIRGLHHSAYRCRDSEETRAFYEDFLGLPLAEALAIGGSEKAGPKVLHTFFRMEDGSYLAFFEAPERPFDWKKQSDFDLHIALEVSEETTQQMIEKARAEGRELRGPVDHGICISVYFRDPNGYVVELLHKAARHDELMDPERNGARDKLAEWQAAKA